jgi:hypothetical protein
VFNISYLGSFVLIHHVHTSFFPMFLGKVSFRLLMFKPFAGEVLVGRISDYDDKGLQGEFVFGKPNG